MKKALLLVMLGVLGWIGRPVDLGAALVIDSTAVTPGSAPVGVATPVLVTARISEPTVLPDGVNLQRLDTAGRVVSVMGLLRDDGANGDVAAGDGTFSLRFTIFEQSPGPLTLRVSAAFRGSLTRALSAPLTVNITGSTGTGIAILAPADLAYLSTSPIVVSGTVGDPQAKVTINGVPAAVGAGTFQASVPLVEGTNTLTAVAANSGGSTSTGSVQVTLDTTPPRVAIESPADGLKTTDSTVTVSGTVNDIVVGTVNAQQAQVTVNGAPAVVGNRSFLAQGVALALGANTIQTVARDRSGNSVTTSVVVTRVPPTEPAIRIVSGNNQSAAVSTAVAAPLVIALDNGLGQPAASVPVVFRVTDNNGIVTAAGNSASSLAVTTDASGRAQVSLQLGSRAGSGSNRVEATASGFVGTAAFTATGTATGASLITVDSGNSQTGALAAKLAFPFVVVVTDAGFNRLGGVPVTFTVKQGGGSFAGKQTLQMNTDPDGRAAAFLSLGTEPGVDNNLVEATFTGNKAQPAAFIASAKAPGNAADTRITGVVLDNSNTPIAGVTVRLFQTHQGSNNNTPIQVGTPVRTDAQGQFLMAGAPVGFFKLMADGTTVSPTRGVFPTLEYDIVTVAGQENTVGMPLLLPLLDQTNKLCVSETEGGTLELPAVPGFSLKVAPGTATFPGGARNGCITVSTVNPDKSPMTPGFGQQPRFLITIQPVGTMFNGPAPITMPNVDGLKPGQVTELYSYDHDLASFVAIGTGTVSEDGVLIKSDPGVGILKAGWHCGGNPGSTGSAASLTLSVDKSKVLVAINQAFSITAAGSPPLDGVYEWTIGSSGVVTATNGPPTCANQTTCLGQFTGTTTPGKTAVKVCFKCTTTGAKECKDVEVIVMKVTLKSLAFTTDHQLMRNNNSNFEASGSLFPKPEWNAGGTNHPISHSMDREVGVKLEFDVAPADVPMTTFALKGTGQKGFNFDAQISLSGGAGTATVLSKDRIEMTIQKLSAGIAWALTYNASAAMQSTSTGPHIVYVTVNTPRNDGDPRHAVTQRRMERAVASAGGAGSLAPHEIVKHVIQTQGDFDLNKPQTNAWVVPDTGGDCQSIVRFAQKVLDMINVPGTILHKNIYAIETAPTVGIEVDPPGGLNNPNRHHPMRPNWILALIDGNGGCNAFEATAKFTHSGVTKYYAGGTQLIFDLPNEVLTVFVSLSWVEILTDPNTGQDVCTVQQVVHAY